MQDKLIALLLLFAMNTNPKTTDSSRLFNDLAQILIGHDDFWAILEKLFQKKCTNGKNALEELFGYEKICPSQLKRSHTFARKIAMQMIYCLAFRQKIKSKAFEDCFKNLFYKTTYVEKGKKKSRRIDVPTKCLKDIQKYLLNRYLDYHLKQLPSYVVSKPKSCAIKGAAFHLYAKYAVNVDIKDFFPSINASMVIPTLKKLARKNNHGAEEATFSHMASVLAGRLLTYRNFLPQGSPASPAIANLVFEYYDREIIKDLGNQFNYSRYIDDITISISRSDAKRSIIDNLKDMRRRVLSTLEEVLSGSGFRLNYSKIRCSESTKESGHFVTGYHVRDGKITIPKAERRFFRGLANRLENSGYNLPFLSTQVVSGKANSDLTMLGEKNKFAGNASKVFYDNEKRRHFHPSRKLSSETLAVKLACKIHPGLRIISRQLENQEGIEQFNFEENSGAKRYLEGLLGLLWRGELIAAIGDETNSIVISKVDKSLVCCLSADNRPDLFMLQKTVALACMEYYMWISGQQGRLHVPDELQYNADKIHLLGLSFRKCFEKFRINAGNQG